MRDWRSCYGDSPVLLETFIEKPRFPGTSYKAASQLRAASGTLIRAPTGRRDYGGRARLQVQTCS